MRAPRVTRRSDLRQRMPLSGTRSRLQPKSHRAVIGKAHPHVRTELAGGNISVPFACAHQQMIEQTSTMFRRRGRREARAHSFAGIRRQGELRHQQQAPCDIAQAQIHLIVRIGEDPVTEQAFQQTIGLRLGIVALDADEHQQALTDGTDARAVYRYTRLSDPLQETDHPRRSANASVARTNASMIPGSVAE